MMKSPVTQSQTTLSDPYCAYHPQPFNLKPNLKTVTATAKPQKSVRFVEGHTTIPDRTPSSPASPFSPTSSSPAPSPSSQDPTTNTTESTSKNSNETKNQSHNNSGTDPNSKSPKRRKTRATNKNGLADDDKAKLPTGLIPRPGATTTTTAGPAAAAAAAAAAEAEAHPDKFLGRYVLQRGAKRAVWRKTVRFRGSGRVRVLDDPVKHGRELATMPGWDDGEGDGEDDGNGNGDGEMTLASVTKREAGFTVKTAAVNKGRRGRGTGKGKKGVKKGVMVRGVGGEEGESVLEPVVGLVEAGSESESCDEGDSFYDFSLEEAEGWVPVMVAEDEAGDDWVSLTGSWVLMRGAAEMKGDNQA